MPIVRTRSRSIYQASGGVFYNNTEFPGGNQEIFRKEITDVIRKTKRPNGMTPPSDLNLRHKTVEGGILTYSQRYLFQPKAIRIFRGVSVVQIGESGHGLPPGGWEALEGTSNELTAELLALTNPFRYTVSVPVMVAELVEAAGLLNWIKTSIAGTIGSAYIVNQWGYEPMVRDIKDLVKITSAIETRVKEFNSLLKTGGLRRKVELRRKGVHGSTVSQTCWSTYGITFSCTATPHYRSKVWGTVRWVPNRDSPIDLTLLTQFNEAAKIVLDLRRPDASTIWEAIPWSWLVDYFLNVGDSLKALEDTDKVIPTDICIMRERTVEFSNELVPASWHNGVTSGQQYYTHFKTGTVRWLHKLREVRPVTGVEDLLSFGIMSKNQATNLFFLLLSFRGRKFVQ